MSPSTDAVQALAARFAAFNQQLITFVAECSPADWRKVTQAEKWTIGVTAHHIGATHYPLLDWVQMFVQGRPLPPVTMAMIDELNRQHAEAHVNCTPAEVLEILHRDGAKALAYFQTITDADLARPGYFPPFANELSTGQLFSAVFIDYAQQHLDSMQATAQAK